MLRLPVRPALLAAFLLFAAPAQAALVRTFAPPPANASDQWVLEHLSSEEYGHKLFAIRFAGERGLTEAVPLLRQILEDLDAGPDGPTYRLEAAVSLWLLGDRSGEQMLRQAMRERKPYVVFRTLKALVSSGDEEAIQMARDYLRAGYPHERRDALEALAGAPQDENAWYALMAAGLEDAATRMVAVRLLGEKGTPRAGRLLAAVDMSELEYSLDKSDLVQALVKVGTWRVFPLLVRAMVESCCGTGLVAGFPSAVAGSALKRMKAVPHPWRADADGASPSEGMEPVDEAPVLADGRLTQALRDDPEAVKRYARILLEWWEQNRERLDLDARMPITPLPPMDRPSPL